MNDGTLIFFIIGFLVISLFLLHVLVLYFPSSKFQHILDI